MQYCLSHTPDPVSLDYLLQFGKCQIAFKSMEDEFMSAWRRLRLAIEIVLLYGVAPVIVYNFVYIRRVPLLELLPWAMAALLLLLLLERNYSWTRALIRPPRFADLLKILGLFLLCGGALTIYAYRDFPQYFLVFPQRAPEAWTWVMIFYPLISVTTQELLYRVFYFHRYAPLFGDWHAAAIVFNAVLFAFMHATLFAYRSVPFHWEAVAISFGGGLIFAYRYYRTKSFWAVAIEHSLYGDLIFTIGLGVFFFTGVSNL
jgi:membrane protease YdiL (CAAX protease family)